METPKNNPVEKRVSKVSFDLKLSITKLIMDKFQLIMPQKYGISHGTLAYWIKNCLTLNQNPKL
jgi:hypothetical protein